MNRMEMRLAIDRGEELPRINQGDTWSTYGRTAFDNGLNLLMQYFHNKKTGITLELCYGIEVT